MAAAFVVGDSLFGHPDHHGTSQERMDAFTLGWSYGDFQACTDTYLG
ncbi:MAG: hypothetical protein Q8K58_08775 [Acidimicrobiales bacterium]|nr:hypothetical protein [Acidimicrobiales bacterium]